MAFMNIRSDFTEVERLLEGIDPATVKIIGSYLYYPQYNDIDCAVYDQKVALKLLQNASKLNYKVDIRLITKDDFDNIEDLITFKNLCMCYHCGKMYFSKKFINSDELEFNTDATKLYMSIVSIKATVEKLKQRGFKLTL